ncbi:hypothetical protein JOM56_008485 [Amanita muscaria]
MDLPSTRELELEALLRLRDAQLSQLTDEVTHLRHFLPSQADPPTSEVVSLPPSFASLLLPHIISPSSDLTPGSGTVTAALSQRAQLLQEENDELYEVLKHGETGKLKEEVRGLRRVVERLETALRQSHQVIETLSAELEKSYSTYLVSVRQTANTASNKADSHSPRNSYHPLPRSTQSGNGSHGGKPPPTGPRAHKKPRLSEPRAATPTRSSASAREYTSRHESHHRAKNQHPKMDVDNNEPKRTSSPPRERMRGRDRERGHKERDRDRDREGRNSRRNGNFSTTGRGGGRRTDRNAGPTSLSGDRTLAERLGL